MADRLWYPVAFEGGPADGKTDNIEIDGISGLAMMAPPPVLLVYGRNGAYHLAAVVNGTLVYRWGET